MTREWKPGNVAKSRYGVVFKTERGWIFDDGSGPNGPETESYPPADLRPLVVIDPEDREQVGQLADLFDGAVDGGSGWTGAMQAALREFANLTPPKPEEPTGHLAVVEDVDGVRWVNWRDPRDGAVAHDRHWQSSEMDAEKWCNYSDINVVRVLSEGVTP